MTIEFCNGLLYGRVVLGVLHHDLRGLVLRLIDATDGGLGFWHLRSDGASISRADLGRRLLQRISNFTIINGMISEKFSPLRRIRLKTFPTEDISSLISRIALIFESKFFNHI